MSTTPDGTLDPQRLIAELHRQLAESNAERDEAQQQLIERTAERDDGEAQQTAITEVLGVINSSPGDLAPVFEAMLEKAMSLCDAAFGLLRTIDGEIINTSAHRGAPDALLDILTDAKGSARTHGVAGELIRGQPFVQELDARRGGNPFLRALADLGGARTILWVPLRKDEALLGFLILYRKEVRAFSNKEIALLQNFAAQAVIAMENARLITETREALERQTATAEILGVINSSPGDLTPVFDAILQKAHVLCGVTYGSLQLYDGEKFRAVAVQGHPEAVADQLRRGFTPTPNSHSQMLLDGKRFAHVHDMRGVDDPLARGVVELAGIRTALRVALRKDGTLLGQIVAGRTEVRPFSNKQIALLENFAAQAVIAMENARLLGELRDRTTDLEESLEYQTATSNVLKVISRSAFDLQPVLTTLVETAARLCDADRGLITTQQADVYRVVATFAVPPEFDTFLRGMQIVPNRETVTGRVLLERQVIHIDDVASDPEYAVPVASFTEGAHTVLGTPLMREGEPVGVIVLARHRVEPFTSRQIELVRTFSDQAVIAMENARLITETREALDQQTATAEVLQVINSSPGDLAPVFDVILEKACVLCGFAHGTFNIYDGEYFRTVAFYGIPEPFAEVLRRSGRTGSKLERLLRSEQVVHMADITAMEFSSDDPVNSAAVSAGIRTVLFVPLRKDGTLLGFITANRHEVRPFTEKQIALLQNFAAQAVIAMENARLITETREALEQQTATAEVLQVINASPGDLVPVFEAILEKAHRLCGIDFGALQLQDGRKFRSVAARGLSEALAELLRQPFEPTPGSPPSRLLGGERIVHIADMTELAQPGTVDARAQAVSQDGFRTGLFVPLRKDADLLGYIVALRREVRPYSEKEIALLQNFAAQAVIAMENARLLGELRQRTDNLTESLEYQTAISDVLKVISQSNVDLEPVLQTVLDTAMRLCGNGSGTIFRLSDTSYRLAVHSGLNPVELQISADFNHIAGDGSLVGRAALEGRPVHILNSWMDPQYGLKEDANRASWRTMLGVPLLREDIVLGVICMARLHVEPYTEKQIELVRTFADQAVIAIENARLLGELRQRTEEVGELNRDLEARVAEQVDELGRVGRLKRFLAPQLAELIVSQGDEKILESHRREIVVVFCDLRGYTAFTETAEPEEVLDFLREYHGALGPLVSQFEGTLDQFSGDGIMVFFNDPVPCADPAERAVKMAVAMRSAANTLIADWRERGRDLGFGAGIAQGYATLGQIGFSERSGYTAIGTVCNVAARLCAEAKDGQILLGQRVNVALKGSVATEQLGPLTLKGLTQPVVAYNVPLGAIQPALRVIEGGSPETV